MAYLIATVALLLIAVALVRSSARPSIRSCPNCHAPLGAGQIDCPVCTRR